MKQDRFRALALAVTAISLFMIASPGVVAASAVPAFSNGSLKGSYSILMNNWTSDPSRTEDLIAVFNFDGTGKVSITSFTDNKVGTLSTGTGSGTYSVKANGSGSMNITLSNGESGIFGIVINAKGKGFQIMCTNCDGDPNVLSATAIASGGSSFSNASLKGAYEFLTTQWPTPKDSNAQNELGILTFDGVGKVNASITENVAGNVTIIKASGTYSVNSDGSGSFTLTPKTGSITYVFAIDNAGKGFQLIEAVSGGSVQSGTATHQ
ncbi:MAG TPA: hypothetical protein VN777_00620 [Terriglobales bacterium]|nr:hypothetical protein [Terriglobales bacterium]